MRIETVAVRVLQAILQVAKFGTERGGAGHRCIHMEPEVMLAADCADLPQGSMAFDEVVPTVPQTKKGISPGSFYLARSLRQALRTHCESFVHFDQTQILPADASDLNCLLDRGVGLG